MTNNDVLRRIRYTFNFDDAKTASIFALGGLEVTPEQVVGWLKQDDDPAFQSCNDAEMVFFLNGLISEKRGKKDGEQPAPVKKLTNNIIFMKLKIALNLKADEVLEVLDLADTQISRHELSAFFRRPDHKHYRECKDQILRNFLKGMNVRYRNNFYGNAG